MRPGSPPSVGAARTRVPWRLRLAAATGVAAGTLAAWTVPPGSGGTPLAPVSPPPAQPEAAGAPPALDAAASAAKEPEERREEPLENEPASPDETPRVYAKTRFVWIREEPSWSSRWLGYLWSGGSVALSKTTPTHAPGCDAWYAVAPRGYVCVDGRSATLHRDDPGYRAVAERRGDYHSPWPHRYAESLGAERYLELPDAALQAARERDLRAQQERVRVALEESRIHPFLEGVDLTPASLGPITFSDLSKTVQVRRNTLKKRSTIAYLSEHLSGDRSFLLTSDLAWVPKDRVRPYAPVAFSGAHLGGSVRLPLAFFRERDRSSYRRSSGGHFEPTGEHFRRLEWVSLTGEDATVDGQRYLQTGREGLWVRADEAVVPEPARTAPWGAPTLAPDTTPRRPGARATWVQVSISGGWLIAYEGTYPVFTTLISPGIGGAARADRDPLETSASPTGHYTVTGKFVTATLDAPTEVVHEEVPWVMNFTGPYALHGAYWHDAWGERKSGGCVNLSPRDGKWLFEWSEPRLPAGWHGVRLDALRSGSTAVWIHR